MAKNYNGDSIETLEYPGCVRKRPDMYMGATSGKFAPALFRCLREIIDNSLDEYICGHNDKLYIFYDSDKQELTVIDN